MKTPAQNLKVGDKIMPPEREIRLWMLRRLQEIKQPESALQLTVTNIREASPDKKGRWLLVSGLHTPEWTADYVDPNPERHPFKFKVRPETLWQLA